MKLVLSFLVLLDLALLHVEAGHWECTEDSECPMYHWCHRIYQGFSTVGSECMSNIEATFGPPCNGDDAICKINDSRLDSTNRGDSTAMCFDHMGVKACRESYFMPCYLETDCADGFGCEWMTFSDGPAAVCLPRKWYQGGGERCDKVQDCGFATYFGYRWMPCSGGTCDRIVA